MTGQAVLWDIRLTSAELLELNSSPWKPDKMANKPRRGLTEDLPVNLTSFIFNLVVTVEFEKFINLLGCIGKTASDKVFINIRSDPFWGTMEIKAIGREVSSPSLPSG